MGIQGPLAALALKGRSPFDEAFDGQGEADHREPPQRFDQRGRPINPETKKLNRDLIRAHNEVMLVIGVAEPENPHAGPEAESQARHILHEEAVSCHLGNIAQQCVQAVGVFGVAGARERVLVYRRYSQIPFWDLYDQARKNFSIPSMVLAGAPSSLLTNYIEPRVARLWFGEDERQGARRVVQEVWSYVKVHLELFAAMQHLGIIPYRQLLPSPAFFIPFSSASPIPTPAPPVDLSGPALLDWVGNAIACATPFILWVMARRLYRDWRPRIFGYILMKLPSTMFSAKRLPRLPLPVPPPIPGTPVVTPADARDAEEVGVEVEVLDQSSNNGAQEEIFESPTPLSGSDEPETTSPGAPEVIQGVLSARAEDVPSDEEDNEGLSATLISFDVEATDSAEAPAGLWSAELRPSAGPDFRPLGPVHFSSGLTQLPVALACDILTDSFVRLALAPYEAAALRNLAAVFLLRQGLSVAAISRVRPFEGLTMTALVNFLSIELLHLSLSGEIWAVCTRLAQYFHRSEEEWKMDENVPLTWLEAYMGL